MARAGVSWSGRGILQCAQEPRLKSTRSVRKWAGAAGRCGLPAGGAAWPRASGPCNRAGGAGLWCLGGRRSADRVAEGRDQPRQPARQHICGCAPGAVVCVLAGCHLLLRAAPGGTRSPLQVCQQRAWQPDALDMPALRRREGSSAAEFGLQRTLSSCSRPGAGAARACAQQCHRQSRAHLLPQLCPLRQRGRSGLHSWGFATKWTRSASRSAPKTPERFQDGLFCLLCAPACALQVTCCLLRADEGLPPPACAV